MTDDELFAGLAERKALIVHFSHHANMREGGVFPEDLQDAIKNRNQWKLSCCVVWPGHRMNLPGSVGVIFRPRSTTNIVSVSNVDSGSHEGVDGEDQSSGDPLSTASFAKSFDVEVYNEWRVLDTDVEGIFVSNPNNIYVKKKQCFQVLDKSYWDIAMQPIQLSEVMDAFPNHPIITMGPHGPHRLR
ncbi:hypothetical protein [Paraburkholderia hospita]|uniref:hypothetical protein n=1 Tax=Paraburkholderia hospita TaxID=169430 RepID=UPI0010545C75|nr:hypothetical protein [Paraburkholderia hospita]